VLLVPSVIVQTEYNYLINPAHPGFEKIRVLAVDDFVFDSRLFGSQTLPSRYSRARIRYCGRVAIRTIRDHTKFGEALDGSMSRGTSWQS
jgi:hypothetical protein